MSKLGLYSQSNLLRLPEQFTEAVLDRWLLSHAVICDLKEVSSIFKSDQPLKFIFLGFLINQIN